MGWWNRDVKIGLDHNHAFIATDDWRHRLSLVNLESGTMCLVPDHSEQRSQPLNADLFLGPAASGERKVLRIHKTSSCKQFCDVLTLPSAYDDCDYTLWRESQAPPVPVNSRFLSSAVLVNGMAYFLVHTSRARLYGFDVQDNATLNTMASF